MPHPLDDDALLRDVPMVEGGKHLPPCVLVERVGRGGMGTVYRGRHLNFDIDVAVKVLDPDLARSDPRFVARFEREARLAAKVAEDNLNVVRVLAVGEAYGLHYLTMEFVHGETARTRVVRKGALAPAEALAIVTAVARGVAGAHRHRERITHRDIKPANVLITAAGRVKVADLGLAKSTTDPDLSQSRVMGTPRYMAPEQWFHPDVGPTADVWAIGALWCFLLTGRDPFPHGAAAAPEYDVDVELRMLPKAIRAVVGRCLRQRPEERFADAQELLDALRRSSAEVADDISDPGVATLGSVTTQVSPIPVDAPRPVRRRRRVAAVAAVLVALAAAGWGATQVDWQKLLPTPASASAKEKAEDEQPAKVTPEPVAEPQPDPGAQQRQEAADALARGTEWVRLPGTLDQGLAELERARGLDPDLAEASDLLVATCREAAAACRAGDPARVIELAARASAVREDAELVAWRGEAESAIRSRLQQAVQWSPGDGAVVPRSVELAVSFTDDLVRDVRAGGEAVPILAGRGRRELTFAEDGEVQVAVQVVGPAGVTAERNLAWLVDETPPEIVVREPEEPSAPRRSPVTVRGTVKDVGAVTVTVAGREVAVEGGAFASEVELGEGEQEVVVAAVDRAGLRGEERVRVTIDDTAPVLTLPEGVQRTRTATCRIAVGVSEPCTVTVDGVDLAAEGDAAEAEVAMSEDGKRVVEVLATDRAGNVARGEVTVERDTVAPVLTVKAPTGPVPSWTERTVVVRGDVTGATTVTVDGQAAVADAFATEVRVAEGRTTPIVVIARDEAGNEARHEIAVEGRATGLPVGWRVKVLGEEIGEQTGLPVRMRHEPSGVVLRLVEPGEFVMGCFDDGRLKKHRVRITRAFYLGETEVSVGQFRRIMNGQKTKAEAEGQSFSIRADGSEGEVGWACWYNPLPGLGFLADDNSPVTHVSFDEAVAATKRIGGGAMVFRLPTEAEWEYACRAGTATSYWWGSSIEDGVGRANLWDRSARALFPKHDFGSLDSRWAFAEAKHENPFALDWLEEGRRIDVDDGTALLAPVGHQRPNPWGLHDMLGNVGEWCQDYYSKTYYTECGELCDDPRGPAGMASSYEGKGWRVIRGGSWRRNSECGGRDYWFPEYRSDAIGFRVALSIDR